MDISKTESHQRQLVADFFDEYDLVLFVICNEVIDILKTALDMD